ncbi:unnamed protein product [Lymnaea stagnalis]|uniref:THD domain-containing protein n=1 Tax=Lymnaea stagnalis TaxID=6523 RepID=A0AAV2HFT7_LYMST
MSNIYDPNTESTKPFIQKNNNASTSANGTSTSSNANNGNNNIYANSMAQGPPCKTTPHDLDYSDLMNTVAKLKVWLYVITGVSISGFVILIIVVTCLYATLNYDLTHHNHKPKVGEQIAAILEREELCLPCDDLLTGPSPDERSMLDKFTQKDSKTGLRCCVDQPDELLELLKLYVEKRFRQEMAKGTVYQRGNPPKTERLDPDQQLKPVAHLMMAQQDLQNIAQISGRQYYIGKWIHSEDIAFTSRVEYRHGRLVIPEDGYYYIYSQISFLEMFDVHNNDAYGSKGSSDSPSLSHYLYRYNILYHNGGEEKLAQNSITKCWGQSKTFGEYTSNLGAVLLLRNGDEIFIKVSNISMVATDPKLSYFGLFKV